MNPSIGAATRQPASPPGSGLGAVQRAGAPGPRILLTTDVPDQKTAWTKARMDVRLALAEEGYEPLAVPAAHRASDWLKLLGQLRARLAPGGGDLVIEYPFAQRKRIYPLRLLSWMAGARLHAVIHDLDSLRFSDSPPGRELAILGLFDGLVSHNHAMTEWLRDGGIRSRIVELNLFDYRTSEAPGTFHEDGVGTPLKVACAANLSFDKARYVYDPRLARLRDIELDLYGDFFEPDRAATSPFVHYKGAFCPDRPELARRYHFGLIWDGTGVDKCDGPYGRYMRFNNPHKLSLYVALGLPVIVWEESAIAAFVQRCGLGAGVRDLRQMGELAHRISTADYLGMTQNVARLREAVRSGAFLHDALIRLMSGAKPCPAAGVLAGLR